MSHLDMLHHELHLARQADLLREADRHRLLREATRRTERRGWFRRRRGRGGPGTGEPGGRVAWRRDRGPRGPWRTAA
ncbi:hypothetical protein RKE29_26385 [Streptomyces sp. B1866]|uniref:hypothetical protein n=1 Tax=Streptomyces sp. B1866 TaxID=3075431 RepID=UPI0028914768|nr:hypothetical protein [Streptomyces sp. B1866]MDT3400110.1 hypothetical protein [Streptomyces sp. B1866]